MACVYDALIHISLFDNGKNVDSNPLKVIFFLLQQRHKEKNFCDFDLTTSTRLTDEDFV